MKKIFAILQKIGKSLMLPVSVLPAAGLLLRFGQSDLLNIPYMAQAGDAIFSNLPMIFATGVAIGFTGGESVAALAAVVGQFVLQSIINMGVIGGIGIGLISGALYNRFYDIRLPNVLGFFSGKRFVPIITSFAALIFAIIAVNIWSPIQLGINAFSEWSTTTVLGPALYAAGKRLLIPLGLHHIYYPVFLYQFGEYVSNGVTYFGDSARYFQGDPTAGYFMASEFPILMFGLPGGALAMIAAAKKENRKKVSGIMISAAFVSFLTGITEAIEFSFIFVAPILFVFHVAAAFLSGIVTSLLGIRLGYTFSASFIDYILGLNYAGHPWLIWLVGFAFFVLYFVVFYFTITYFNLKTPGREDEMDILSMSINIKGRKRAEKVLEAMGGKENLQMIDACITRLRVTLDDPSKLQKGMLKALGAAGVMIVGNSIHAIFGTDAERIKDDIKNIITGGSNIRSSNSDVQEKIDDDDTVGDDNNGAIGVYSLYNPIEGEIVGLESVPDEAFAGRFLGDGFAVMPIGNKIYAPANGEVSVLFPTMHAIVILTEEGLEILIHIGIDTVNLNGEGFTSYVKQGDKVNKGSLLISFDTKVIEPKAKSLITPVVITNLQQVESITVEYGKKKVMDKAASVKLY